MGERERGEDLVTLGYLKRRVRGLEIALAPTLLFIQVLTVGTMGEYPGPRSSSRGYRNYSPSSPSTIPAGTHRSRLFTKPIHDFLHHLGGFSTSQVATQPPTLLPLTQERRCAARWVT